MIGFNHPVAFMAAAALLLLLLFSFWRRRPVDHIVGSLRLWKEVPDRVTPLKTAKRPRFSLSLLLQALAILAMVTALASPYLWKTTRIPRKITLVVDTSARLLAKGNGSPTRFETGISRALERAEELDGRDSVTVLFHSGSPKIWKGSGDELRPFLRKMNPVEYRVDLSTLLVARDPETELWVLSDAPVEASLFLPAGGGVDNTGIVHVSFIDGQVFVRLIRSGSDAKGTLEVFAGGKMLKRVPLTLREGVHRWNGEVDPGDAGQIRISLREEDSFALDNTAWLNQWSSGNGVTYSGRDHVLLLRVLQSIPGVRLGKAGCMVAYRDARAFAGPAIYVDPPSAPQGFSMGVNFVPTSWNVVDHPLTRHVRLEDLGASSARQVSGGSPLLFADGKCVAAVRGDRVVLGFDLPSSGWVSSPSFPIFWTNVFDFVTTSGGWRTFLTGVPVPGEKTVPVEIGEFSARGNLVGISLLDSEESDLKPVPVGSVARDSTGKEQTGQASVAAGACLLALFLVLVSWWSDRSGR